MKKQCKKNVRLWVLVQFLAIFHFFPAKAQQSSDSIPKENLSTFKVSHFLTRQELIKAHPIDLWSAIKLLNPSVSDVNESLYGSDPNYISTDVRLRQTTGWQHNGGNMPVIILDGAQVSFQKIKDLDINDVEYVFIHRDSYTQSYYGIKGSEGVIEVVTRQLQKGDVKISYALDMSLESADISSYNLMNAREKLEYEKSKSLYSLYPDLLQEREQDANKSTNWLKVPLRTAFVHKHKLDVSGGDEFVKYKFSVRYAPNQHGVMKGSKKTMLGLGSQIEYRYKSLTISNTLTFDEINRRASSYGSFDYLAKLNPYYSSGNPAAMLGNESFNEQINPEYEASLSSFDKIRLHQIYDNLNISWDLGHGFFLRGRFAFVRDIEQEDIYISPLSAIYENNTSADDYTGKYDILRNNRTTYEGNISLSYYNNTRGKSTYGGFLEFRPYSGKYTYETFGGVGIPTDKMSFINFSKYYTPNQTPEASRIYDHTFSSFLKGYYDYDNRYFLEATMTVDRSSMLAKDKRNAVFYSVGAKWDIKKEKFLRHASVVKELALNANIGTSGRVDFGSNIYNVNYSYRTDGSYNYFINNYQLIGATITGMPNYRVKWGSVESKNIALYTNIKDIILYLNYYNDVTTNLLTWEELPLATGFDNYVGNNGKITNSGIEYNISANIINRDDLKINLFTGGIHNKYKIKNVGGGIFSLNDSVTNVLKDPSLRGNFGFSTNYKRWVFSGIFKYTINNEVYNSTLAEYVDNPNPFYNVDKRAAENQTYDSYIQKMNEFSLGALQVGYRFTPEVCRKLLLRDFNVMLSGNNLWHSSSIDMQRGIYYPYARSFTFSLRATF